MKCDCGNTIEENPLDKDELMCNACVMACDHMCTSDCRREGCNCSCGEYHIDSSDLVEVEYKDKVVAPQKEQDQWRKDEAYQANSD